jgi:hypothetical protein
MKNIQEKRCLGLNPSHLGQILTAYRLILDCRQHNHVEKFSQTNI